MAPKVRAAAIGGISYERNVKAVGMGVGFGRKRDV